MTEPMPTENIKRAVGAKHHLPRHIARAVSATGEVYLHHPEECSAIYGDLRACPFSSALDWGILEPYVRDKSVTVRIQGGFLKFESEE